MSVKPNKDKNRRQKRQEEKLRRKLAQARPTRPGGNAELRLSALEDGFEKFQQVFSRNVQLTNKGLAVGDNHFWVLSAIVADLASGQARMNEKGELDFQHYYNERTKFLQKMAEEEKAKQEAKKKPAEQKPSEPVEEFGGDYGESETGSEDPSGQQVARGAEEHGNGGTEADPVPEVPQDDPADQGQPGQDSVQV